MKNYWIYLSLLLMFSFGFSQTNCELCVEVGGFYCGDDESNWTQYSPLGCVPNGFGGLFYLNDGWSDCNDSSDENETIPTTLSDCDQYAVPCDTVYVNTIDTMYINIIDTVYIDIINWFPEYVDCETLLPCNTGIEEILKDSQNSNLLYNLQGQIIKNPKGVYIENGKVKWQR